LILVFKKVKISKKKASGGSSDVPSKPERIELSSYNSATPFLDD
jgi:hypothetical protein